MPAPKHNANTASCSVNNTLVDSFTSSLHALGPFEPQPHLAVALSGGVDSTALVLLARTWAKACGGNVSALVVDHRLRDESTREAQDVAKRLDAIVLTPEHTDTSNNLPEQAREWRYDALTSWCKTHDVLHLLVAHHADDQAETVALHTARGQTEDGAAGIAAVTLRNGVRIVRPLLGVHKSALKEYVQAHGVSWVEDPTNANVNFKRNALRAIMTEAETSHLLTIATREGEARALRDKAFAKAAALVSEVGADFVKLDLPALLALSEPIATRLLADSLCAVSGSYTRPRKHETMHLFAKLHEPDFQRGTLKHCLVEKRENALHISSEPHKIRATQAAKPLAASPFWWLNLRA